MNEEKDVVKEFGNIETMFFDEEINRFCRFWRRGFYR